LKKTNVKSISKIFISLVAICAVVNLLVNGQHISEGYFFAYLFSTALVTLIIYKIKYANNTKGD
jgi:hypothetical protein